jgi:nitric oxide reductase activation protein
MKIETVLLACTGTIVLAVGGASAGTAWYLRGQVRHADAMPAFDVNHTQLDQMALRIEALYRALQGQQKIDALGAPATADLATSHTLRDIRYEIGELQKAVYSTCGR